LDWSSDVRETHPIPDSAEQEKCKDYSENGPFSAVNVHPTQHHRSHDKENCSVRIVTSGRPVLTDPDERRERCQRSREGVRANFDGPDLDP